MLKSIKVLLIATSTDTLGDSAEKTGVWLDELASPYFIFKDGGAYLTIASPKGGKIPVDPKSESIITVTRNTKRFKNDTEAMNHLQRSQPLHEMKEEQFDVVFIAGGAGAMWDLSNSHPLKQLLEAFIRSKKPIGAIGHGVAALLPVNNDKGQSFLKGVQVTAPNNAEEDVSHQASFLPFQLQTKLESLGAVYQAGDNFVSHVVADGNLITGQNSASAEETAKSTLALIRPIYNKVKKYS